MLCYYGTNVNIHRIFFYFFKYTYIQTWCFILSKLAGYKHLNAVLEVSYVIQFIGLYNIGLRVIQTWAVTQLRHLALLLSVHNY